MAGSAHQVAAACVRCFNVTWLFCPATPTCSSAARHSTRRLLEDLGRLLDFHSLVKQRAPSSTTSPAAAPAEDRAAAEAAAAAAAAAAGGCELAWDAAAAAEPGGCVLESGDDDSAYEPRRRSASQLALQDLNPNSSEGFGNALTRNSSQELGSFTSARDAAGCTTQQQQVLQALAAMGVAAAQPSPRGLGGGGADASSGGCSSSSSSSPHTITASSSSHGSSNFFVGGCQPGCSAPVAEARQPCRHQVGKLLPGFAGKLNLQSALLLLHRHQRLNPCHVPGAVSVCSCTRPKGSLLVPLSARPATDPLGIHSRGASHAHTPAARMPSHPLLLLALHRQGAGLPPAGLLLRARLASHRSPCAARPSQPPAASRGPTARDALPAPAFSGSTAGATPRGDACAPPGSAALHGATLLHRAVLSGSVEMVGAAAVGARAGVALGLGGAGGGRPDAATPIGGGAGGACHRRARAAGVQHR